MVVGIIGGGASGMAAALAAAENRRKLLALFLDTEVFQTFTHGAAQIAAAAAGGAEGRVVQIARLEVGLQKLLTLFFQSPIGGLGLGHGILRTFGEGGKGGLHHIALELLVDFLNAGQSLIDLRPAGVGFGFVVGPEACQTGVGPG